MQGVSLEALAACMQSLSVAASTIGKNSSAVDGQLFEIKHLLILREQLASFQVSHEEVFENGCLVSKMFACAVDGRFGVWSSTYPG